MIDLSLSLRLRRALQIALILGLWAPMKIMWEQKISHEQTALRYHGAVVMTRELRDQLKQGLAIGILSGMRPAVADYIWLSATVAWEKEEWFKMASDVDLCTTLQPRFVTFWEIGGWQLAWNASVAAMRDVSLPSDLRRLRASKFWIDKGLDIYLRGIENNPETYRLWAATGQLYQQRLVQYDQRTGNRAAVAEDYRKAAYYYAQANRCADAPVFLERFPAIMYGNAGDDQDAYEAWASLWKRLTPEQREQKVHWKEKIESNIRRLEQKLSIPKEKRIFPN